MDADSTIEAVLERKRESGMIRALRVATRLPIGAIRASYTLTIRSDEVRVQAEAGRLTQVAEARGMGEGTVDGDGEFREWVGTVDGVGLTLIEEMPAPPVTLDGASGLGG